MLLLQTHVFIFIPIVNRDNPTLLHTWTIIGIYIYTLCRGTYNIDWPDMFLFQTYVLKFFPMILRGDPRFESYLRRYYVYHNFGVPTIYWKRPDMLLLQTHVFIFIVYIITSGNLQCIGKDSAYFCFKLMCWFSFP